MSIIGLHCSLVLQKLRVQILTLISDPQFLPVDAGIVLTLGDSCVFEHFVSETEQHTGKHDITELQKAVTLSASHKLRKVLTWKCKAYLIGEKELRVARIVNTDQLQHYILYKRGLFGYINNNNNNERRDPQYIHCFSPLP
jgi:hypothetical protein